MPAVAKKAHKAPQRNSFTVVEPFFFFLTAVYACIYKKVLYIRLCVRFGKYGATSQRKSCSALARSQPLLRWPQRNCFIRYLKLPFCVNQFKLAK